MKKNLIIFLLSFCCLGTKAQFISACYIVEAHGAVYVTMVSPSPTLPPGTQEWIDDGSATYWPMSLYAGPFLDDDGVNWDYIFRSSFAYDYYGNPNPCYTVYYGPSGSVPPATATLTACLCSPITAGCYTLVNGVYHIKLVFNNSYYMAVTGPPLSLPPSEFTPELTLPDGMGGYNIIIGMAFKDVAEDLNSWIPDPDGNHWDVYYDVPATDIVPDPNTGCLTFDVGQERIVDGTGGHRGAQYMGPQQPVTICPCCTSDLHISLSTTAVPGFTENFTSSMLASWTFGDGGTGTGTNVSHTYTLPGTYTVCANSTNGDGEKCSQCNTFCLADPNVTGISGGLGSPCNANFSVNISGGTITVINWYSLTCGGYFQYDFGDGTPPATGSAGFITHTYATSGVYTVCVTANVVDCHSDLGRSCDRCMDICVTVPSCCGNPSSRSRNPAAVAGNTNTSFEESLILVPNPAATATNIRFGLQKVTDVRITVVDALGRISADFNTPAMLPGNREIQLNTSNLTPGVYTVNVRTAYGISTRRLIVIR